MVERGRPRSKARRESPSRLCAASHSCRKELIITSFFTVRLGPYLLELLPELFLLLEELDLLFQFLHPVEQGLLLRVLLPFGASAGLILHRREQGFEGALLPFVITLTGDAQLLGRLFGRQLARPDLEDECGSKLGAAHLGLLCARCRCRGKLDLLQPFR